MKTLKFIQLIRYITINTFAQNFNLYNQLYTYNYNLKFEHCTISYTLYNYLQKNYYKTIMHYDHAIYITINTFEDHSAANS